MNIYCLPDAVRKRLEAEFGDEYPIAILRADGTLDGDAGEGYARMTLCLPEKRLQEAVERIRTAGIL